MSDSARWTIGTLGGLAAWIGAMVLVAVLNGDASNPTPIVLTFVIGAAVFFGAVFGIALWQTRLRPSPGLDALLESLTLVGHAPPTAAAAHVGGRRTVRLYLVLGIVVTALGLAAILLGVLGSPFVRIPLVLLSLTILGWSAAAILILRDRRAVASALLEPLGLEQRGADIVGRRHGRGIRITFSARGTRTTVKPERGDPVVIARNGHPDDGWLRDLAEAEQRAAAASTGA
jgi:hypothetical protein